MGEVLHVRFRKAKKRRRAPGLALTFGATSDGRIVMAASGRRYFSTDDFTTLIREMRRQERRALKEEAVSLMPTERQKLESAQRSAALSDTMNEALSAHVTQLENDNFALKARVLELEGRINTPHTDDWFEAVRLEAAHQVERFGAKHDAGKAPQDWFWLLAYLSGKALASAITGDDEKAKHHTISSGAMLLNWYRQLAGDSNVMRPGIADPEAPR